MHKYALDTEVHCTYVSMIGGGVLHMRCNRNSLYSNESTDNMYLSLII